MWMVMLSEQHRFFSATKMISSLVDVWLWHTVPPDSIAVEYALDFINADFAGDHKEVNLLLLYSSFTRWSFWLDIDELGIKKMIWKIVKVVIFRNCGIHNIRNIL